MIAWKCPVHNCDFLRTEADIISSFFLKIVKNIRWVWERNLVFIPHVFSTIKHCLLTFLARPITQINQAHCLIFTDPIFSTNQLTTYNHY